MVLQSVFLVKKRPFKQYLNKNVKIKQPKKPETRTKVDFLFKRVNILSKSQLVKLIKKLSKSQLFETNLDLVKISIYSSLIATVLHKYIEIRLHLLMHDRHKHFCLSNEGLHAIPSSNLRKKNDEAQCKIT